MLKRTLSLFVALLLATPALAQLTLTGAGGGVTATPLTPPSLLPQAGAYLDSNQAGGYTNNALQTNGGTAGAFEVPSTVTQSTALYVEGQTDSNSNVEYALGTGSAKLGLSVSPISFGTPEFIFQTGVAGASLTSSYFWLGTNGIPMFGTGTGMSVTAGSGYISGVYNWVGSGCQTTGSTGRNPTGLISINGSGQVNGPVPVDAGILCPQPILGTSAIAAVAGIGASQATGSGTGTTCTSNTPTSSSFTVTAHVAVAHGVNPGQSFTLAGFTPSGYNLTYAALAGTSGTTLIGAYNNTTGTCPAAVSAEGTVGAGASGAIAASAPGANPFAAEMGTAIQVQPNQRFCGVIGEFGSESNFPGAQFAEFTDQTGTELPGSPFVDPWLNQGTVTFYGYTTTTQPSLTVTSFPTTTISGAVYNSGTGYVNFTVPSGSSGWNGMTIGSEFTVSGVTSTGTGTFNGTYVAVTGTNSATGALYGNLLTGPAGYPTAFTGSPTYSSGGTLVGVVMPGMEIPGASGFALIAPYGTNGSTGTGGTGTYELTVTQSGYTTTANTASFSTTSTNGSVGTLNITSGLSAAQNLIIGSTITATTGTGTFTNPTHITNYGTGTGYYGTYGVDVAQTVSAGEITVAGTIGSAGTPVPIFAAEGYYAHSVTPGAANGSTNSSGWAGGFITLSSVAQMGDWINLIGAQKNTATTVNEQGWGGSIANVGMYQGSAWPNSNGAVTTSALDSLCTKTTDFQAFATANSGSWRSLYRLNDGGIWGDSGKAQITGYISGASGTSGGTATLNVSSTVSGSSTAFAANTVIAGSGIAGCDGVNACPKVTSGSGSSYTITFASGVTSANIGSSGSPIAMTAGTYSRAKPIAPLPQFQGQISSSTLTVNSMTAAFSCTGASSLSGTAGAWPYNQLALVGCSSTPVAGAIITDGGVNITGSPLIAVTVGTFTGGAGTVTTNSNDYQPFSGDTTIVGTNAQIVPGQFLLGSGITTPVQVIGYGTGSGGVGTYTLSNSANGTIPASGYENMAMAGVAASGAIAPGAALTVNNTLAPYTTFSVTNFSANTGSVPLAGTYNTGLLGGTPSAIQAQFSYTPNGPPVSGCTACAWTTLSSGAISGGNWSGTAVNIPGGGPYWVSIRAANGTAYTNMPNPVTVGVNIALFGNGGLGGALSGLGGSAAVTYKGFSVASGFSIDSNGYITGGGLVGGPPILGNSAVAPPTSVVADTFGAKGLGTTGNYLPDSRWGLATSASAELSGDPVGLAYMVRNGSTLLDEAIGNTPQTQTAGIGDGSTTTFASGALYGTVSPATTKTANIAVTTAGVMTTSASSIAVPFFAPGQTVSCSSGSGGCAGAGWTGYITGYGTGTGYAGTYYVSPPPGSAIATQTATFTSNQLGFNAASLTGAVITATTANSGGSGLCASLPCVTITGLNNGALEPGLVLTDNNGTTNIPANTTLLGCVSGCGTTASTSGGTSVWELSNTVTTPETGATMYAEPVGGALLSAYNIQQWGTWPLDSTTGGGINGTQQIIQYGTFSVSVNGTKVCQDTTTFAYNEQVGNCTGATVTSSFVDYYSGSFQITFSSTACGGGSCAPPLNAMVVASWTNIQSPDVTFANEQLDAVGSGGFTGGQLSSVNALTGGMTAYSFLLPQISDLSTYQAEAIGAVQMAAHTAARLGALPNNSATAPMVAQGYMRVQGLGGAGNSQSLGQSDQLLRDMATASTWSATVTASGGSGTCASSPCMTLTTAATGPMWEGELIGCAPFTLYCASGNLPVGSQILSLASGTWGANGSTYNIAPPSGGTIGNIASAVAMQNATYYHGAGPIYYTGPMNDIPQANGVGGLIGAAGESNAGGPYDGLRYGERVGVELAAQMSGNPTNAEPPTLSRSATAPGGCDAAATSGTAQGSPCFDVGTGSTTYNASATATWTGSTFTISGGLSVGNRPFVAGMALSCSGCNSGLVATAVSLPPTQSTATGAGQIGQTFTITASGTIGGSGSGTVTGGCSGTSGTGSNCIDIAFNINTAGTYGTAASLATCGVNNLQGYFNGATQDPYTGPNGPCTNAGVGDLVTNFRIGTTQSMSTPGSTGNVYDIGVDPFQTGLGNITYNESNAFTCNIVAAKVVQCIKAPAYSSGIFSSVGQWSSGSTYIEYGDAWGGTGFQGTLVPALGGQTMPFTAGSGYTNGQYVVGGSGCGVQAGSVAGIPSVQATISGGAIVNAYPYSSGLASTLACTFPNASFNAIYVSSSHTLYVASNSLTGTLATEENVFFSGIASPMVISSGSYLGGGGATYAASAVSGSGTSVTYTIPSQASAPTGYITTSGFTTGGYNFTTTPQLITSSTKTSITISSTATGSTSTGTVYMAGPYVVSYTGGSISTGTAMTAGLPPSGSGGAVTQATLQPLQGLSGITTYANDSNLMGIELYDNTCLPGNPLAAQCGNGAGGYVSPGLPVLPFGQYYGAQVGG